MKKVLYAMILLLCLAGGLGVGIIRQRAKAGGTGDGLVLQTPVETPAEGGEVMAEATAEETAMTDATPEETPVESTEVAMAESTPEATPVVAEESMTSSGRSFGGGELKDPVKSSRKSRASSGGGGGSSTTSFESSSAPVSDPIPFNSTMETSVGTVIEDPTPVPKKGKKGKAAATPEPEVVASNDTTVPFDSVDDLPTVDTGDTGADPFASSGNTATAAATPDPFASSAPTEVAMLAPQGSSELVFPSGSGGRASLKKVTQSKRGAETVVKIQINGTAPCKVTHLRASATKPARVFVDFEDTEVPGGATSPISGTAGPIKEIGARYFEGSAGIGTARIEISLTSGEKFPTVKPKGNFQASGTVEVVIGGAESF